jgi:hypothetical protein
MRTRRRNQNWPSQSQRSQRLQKNIGGPLISVQSWIWSSLHSFTSFELESIHHLLVHEKNGPSHCGTAASACGPRMGTSSHTLQGLTCSCRRTVQQYALRTQRMGSKVLWCTTVAVAGQSALLQHSLEELQTSRPGQPRVTSTSSTMPRDASLGLPIARLGLQLDGEQRWTHSSPEATPLTVCHPTASELVERWP